MNDSRIFRYLNDAELVLYIMYLECNRKSSMKQTISFVVVMSQGQGLYLFFFSLFCKCLSTSRLQNIYMAFEEGKIFTW
jgi:hypothetical protein